MGCYGVVMGGVVWSCNGAVMGCYGGVMGGVVWGCNGVLWSGDRGSSMEL